MLQMGQVAVVMVMAAAVMVVAQLEGHKKSILQTLYHSWVLQIYLPVSITTLRYISLNLLQATVAF